MRFYRVMLAARVCEEDDGSNNDEMKVMKLFPSLHNMLFFGMSFFDLFFSLSWPSLGLWGRACYYVDESSD